uniref:Peptidase S1 domain-containing protein n=1 Tax=Anopheles dirus TaxID=7168 RepID=A0A182NBL5_9DIPT
MLDVGIQASRNLRHLPCVVRNTGEEGICMFAIDCFKANGTHLGVCIDKIFFGSCCQVNDDRLLFDPDITDNSIDHNAGGNFQHFPQSPVVNTNRKPPLTETRLPTTPASNGTNYELLSTSTTTRRTTAKTNRRTTTARTTKAPQKVQQKDDIQTTTEYQEFTTFQYVQSSKNPSGSATKRPPTQPSGPSLITQDNRISTTRTTTPKPYKTRRPPTNKTSTIRPPNRRPPQPLTTTTTEAPTTTPPSTTRKVSGQNTRQPTTGTTIGSRKPPSSIAASPTQTTIASRRPTTTTTTTTTTTQSSPKPESTTPSVTYSRRPTTSPSLVPLTKPTSNRRRPTTSSATKPTTAAEAAVSSETTRAPRPRPKPTAQVATVPATSLDHLIETHSTTAAPAPSAAATSSTVRSTYPQTTVKITQPTTPTPTPTPASSTARTTQSEPSVQSSTVKVPESPLAIGDSEDLATLSRPGLVTWTSILEDTPTERPNVNQGTSTTTDASSKRPLDSSPSTTEAVLIRETTTAAEESTESATEGSGEEESGSGSEEGSSEEEEEEEEEEEGTDESEETTDATTASLENVTDSQHKVTNESITSSSTSAESTTVSSTSAIGQQPAGSLESNTIAASTLSPVSISTGVTSPSSSSSTLSTATSTSGAPSTPLPPSPVTSDRGPSTEGTTTGMPIKFPEQTASNQTTQPPSAATTLAMLANVTTDGVTLAPDFLTTSTLPTLEGIDYRSVCGKRMFPEPRIVGGTKAAFGRWPWQISLRQWRTSTYLHKCGAALLNENWAITAAHCVDNVPPSDLLLRLGEYDLALEEEPYGYQERRVQIVASHPQFDPRTFEYDLALLRFYEPVVFQPNIIPVCVPENDENFIGRTAFVTGWGRLYEDGPLPSVLQEVTVPVIENKICETMYRSAGYIEHIPHIFICAGWKKGGYDSCEGDSGGPMVIQRTDKRFLLAGVISWGIGCAEPNQPGVYTRISEFRDWINQILQF